MNCESSASALLFVTLPVTLLARADGPPPADFTEDKPNSRHLAKVSMPPMNVPTIISDPFGTKFTAVDVTTDGPVDVLDKVTVDALDNEGIESDIARKARNVFIRC